MTLEITGQIDFCSMQTVGVRVRVADRTTDSGNDNYGQGKLTEASPTPKHIIPTSSTTCPPYPSYSHIKSSTYSLSTFESTGLSISQFHIAFHHFGWPHNISHIYTFKSPVALWDTDQDLAFPLKSGSKFTHSPWILATHNAYCLTLSWDSLVLTAFTSPVTNLPHSVHFRISLIILIKVLLLPT